MNYEDNKFNNLRAWPFQLLHGNGDTLNLQRIHILSVPQAEIISKGIKQM